MKTLLAREDIDANRKETFNGQTPIMAACSGGHEAIIATLLKHHPVVDLNVLDASQRSVLIHAVDTHRGSCPTEHNLGTFQIVKMLLDTGRVDVNYIAAGASWYDADTALAAAAGRGDIDSVKLLLAAGAQDSNRTENPGHETALLRALRKKQSSVPRLLIESAGSDVRASTERGYTSLHLVQDVDMCRVLLQLGAGDRGRINAVTSESGQTALHRASDGEIATALLEAGANPGILDVEGETALFSAVQWRRTDIVKVLLAFGKSEIDVPAANGVTPLEQAFTVANKEMVRILIEAGAKVDLDALNKVQLSKDASRTTTHQDMLDLVQRSLETI